MDGTLKGIYSLTIPKDCDNKEKVLNYEADRIARIIRQALDDPNITIPRVKQEIEQGKTAKPDPSDFLIINRNKSLLSFYAGKLEEYGIPTRVTGGSALNEVRELKMLYSCVNALTHTDNPVALLAVLRGELFGMSDVALYEFKKAGGRFSFHSEVPEQAQCPICSPVQRRFLPYAVLQSLAFQDASNCRIRENCGRSGVTCAFCHSARGRRPGWKFLQGY